MTVEEAKVIMLAKYPTAGGIQVLAVALVDYGSGQGLSAMHASLDEAWIDAAERIQREEQP